MVDHTERVPVKPSEKASRTGMGLVALTALTLHCWLICLFHYLHLVFFAQLSLRTDEVDRRH